MRTSAILLMALLWPVALLGQTEAVEDLKASIVKITSQAPDGPPRTGTGFIVRVDDELIYIATASHVVDGDSKPQVTFHHDKRRPVAAEMGDLERDNLTSGLGFVIVRNRAIADKVQPLPWGAEILRGGDDVQTIGFGQGLEWGVVKGTVASVAGSVIRIDGRFQDGNSGGPIIRNGVVVGMITATDTFGVGKPGIIVQSTLRGWDIEISAPPPAGDFLIGRNARRSTAPAEAGGARRETAERTDSPPPPPSDLRDIRRLHEKEQWGESLPMLNRLIASGPETPELLALRAHAYSHLGRPADALADGQKAVSAGPRVAEAYLRRGEAFMGEGKHKEALADFDTSLELDPKEAETWGNRGATLAALGQHGQAIESYTRGLALRSDRYDLFVARGSSYFEQGQFKSAITDFTSAIQLHARDALLYAARASTYVRDQQLEAALKDANEAIRLDPDNADSRALRGYIYGLLGSREQAIEDYRYATRLRPDTKEFAEALRALEAAGPVAPAPGATPPLTPSGPGTAVPSYARLVDDARAAMSAQRVAEAAELIDQMIRLDPARSEGWTLRGSLAMAAFDNLAMAYESYKNALDRGGVVAFRVAHDHGLDQAPCFGLLYLSPTGVEFTGDTGHRFNWPHTAIHEAAINAFYGSALGMFHIKAVKTSGGASVNFAVVRPSDVQILNRRADADMLLNLLNRFKH